MTDDKYTIGWNNFQSHLQKSHKNLFNDKLFADVTLVSDDLKKVSAHKTILSNASSVFMQLLTITSNSSNSILYLKGIQYEDLEALLKFIYIGEAKVNEHRIEQFCKIAEDFDLDSANLSDENFKEEPQTNYVNSSFEEDNTIEQNTTSENQADSYDSKNIEQIQVKQDSNVSDLKKESIKSRDCPDCNSSFSNVGNMNMHYRTKHAGRTFPCNRCQKNFTRKVTLQAHLRIEHDGIMLKCKFCDKTFTRDFNRKIHVSKYHE